MKRVALLSLLAACAVDDVVEPELDSTTQALTGEDPCIIWHCGMNSPVVDGVGFHDLSTRFGVANSAGITILRFTQNGVPFDTVRVVDGHIIAANGSVTLTGAALKDGVFWLRNNGTGQLYLMRISAVDDTLPYWANHGVGLPLLENYVFDVAIADSSGNPTSGFRNVCHNPPPARDRAGAPNPDLLGMGSFNAVVFEGDRINASAKAFQTATDPTWFNIGCAGHALAKLQLTGHTYVGALDGLSTTTDERTTMLKMFSADYCGNGGVFTVAGQPLHWMDNHGWMADSAGDTLEARWTSTGAACLNTARVEAHPSAASLAAWPSGIDNATICPGRIIPTCAWSTAFNTFGYHVISANP